VDLAAEKANVLRRLRIKLWQTIDPDQPLTERNEALGVDMDENEKRTLRSLGY
jgi:hypothetical protein